MAGPSHVMPLEKTHSRSRLAKDSTSIRIMGPQLLPSLAMRQAVRPSPFRRSASSGFEWSTVYRDVYVKPSPKMYQKHTGPPTMIECIVARDMTPLPPRLAAWETDKAAHHRVFSMSEQHASRGDPIHAGSRGELWGTIADEFNQSYLGSSASNRSNGGDFRRTFPRSQSQGTLSRASSAGERSAASRR
eukprot:gnl/MRDRNA2_/MRDRNA2_161732_c0_seq1.p1 gnl/MRDRNA2_/MRDRNA2_161732_c0~~gnl/MRDRNA2_/MRDRNA2_161732_c0_seq1.p1  ORF type:complete len:189 (-),score=25.63 gnl/MRDRNA2_/MRDRNA2_161732_c0_seq1:94-660(-)